MTATTFDPPRIDQLRNLARQAESMDGPQLLDAALQAAPLTQADLARLSGLTQNTITAFRKGKRPSAAQRSAILWGIARAYGL